MLFLELVLIAFTALVAWDVLSDNDTAAPDSP